MPVAGSISCSTALPTIDSAGGNGALTSPHPVEPPSACRTTMSLVPPAPWLPSLEFLPTVRGYLLVTVASSTWVTRRDNGFMPPSLAVCSRGCPVGGRRCRDRAGCRHLGRRAHEVRLFGYATHPLVLPGGTMPAAVTGRSSRIVVALAAVLALTASLLIGLSAATAVPAEAASGNVAVMNLRFGKNNSDVKRYQKA